MPFNTVNLILSVPRSFTPVDYKVYGSVVEVETDLSNLTKKICWLSVDCLGSRRISLPKKFTPKVGTDFVTFLSNWSSEEFSLSLLTWVGAPSRKKISKKYLKRRWLSNAFKVGRLSPKNYLMSTPLLNQGFVKPKKDTLIASDLNTRAGRNGYPLFPRSGNYQFFSLKRFRRTVFAWYVIPKRLFLTNLKNLKLFFRARQFPIQPIHKGNLVHAFCSSKRSNLSNFLFLHLFFYNLKIAHRKSKRELFRQARFSGANRLHQVFSRFKNLNDVSGFRFPFAEFMYKIKLYASVSTIFEFFLTRTYLNSDLGKFNSFSTFSYFKRYRIPLRRNNLQSLSRRRFETAKPCLRTTRLRRKHQFFGTRFSFLRREWGAYFAKKNLRLREKLKFKGRKPVVLKPLLFLEKREGVKSLHIKNKHFKKVFSGSLWPRKRINDKFMSGFLCKVPQNHFLGFKPAKGPMVVDISSESTNDSGESRNLVKSSNSVNSSQNRRFRSGQYKKESTLSTAPKLLKTYNSKSFKKYPQGSRLNKNQDFGLKK